MLIASISPEHLWSDRPRRVLCKPCQCRTQKRVRWCLLKDCPSEAKPRAPATLGVMWWGFYLYERGGFDTCVHSFSHETWTLKVSRCVYMCVLSFSHSVAMGREQQENKRAIQNTRHELSQQSAVSIVSLTHTEDAVYVFLAADLFPLHADADYFSTSAEGGWGWAL